MFPVKESHPSRGRIPRLVKGACITQSRHWNYSKLMVLEVASKSNLMSAKTLSAANSAQRVVEWKFSTFWQLWEERGLSASGNFWYICQFLITISHIHFNYEGTLLFIWCSKMYLDISGSCRLQCIKEPVKKPPCHGLQVFSSRLMINAIRGPWGRQPLGQSTIKTCQECFQFPLGNGHVHFRCIVKPVFTEGLNHIPHV